MHLSGRWICQMFWWLHCYTFHYLIYGFLAVYTFNVCFLIKIFITLRYFHAFSFASITSLPQEDCCPSLCVPSDAANAVTQAGFHLTPKRPSCDLENDAKSLVALEHLSSLTQLENRKMYCG